MVKKVTVIRLRIINAATKPILFRVAVYRRHRSVVALDASALETPRNLTDLVLAPAQRRIVIVDITGPVGFDMQSRAGSTVWLIGNLLVTNTTDLPKTDCPRLHAEPANAGRPQPASDASPCARRLWRASGAGLISGPSTISLTCTTTVGALSAVETRGSPSRNDTASRHGISPARPPFLRGCP